MSAMTLQEKIAKERERRIKMEKEFEALPEIQAENMKLQAQLEEQKFRAKSAEMASQLSKLQQETLFAEEKMKQRVKSEEGKLKAIKAKEQTFAHKSEIAEQEHRAKLQKEKEEAIAKGKEIAKKILALGKKAGKKLIEITKRTGSHVKSSIKQKQASSEQIAGQEMEIEILKSKGQVILLENGKEGINVKLEILNLPANKTRTDLLGRLRPFQIELKKVGGSLKLKTLSLEKNKIEAIFPIEDFSTLAKYCNKHHIKIYFI